MKQQTILNRLKAISSEMRLHGDLCIKQVDELIADIEGKQATVNLAVTVNLDCMTESDLANFMSEYYRPSKEALIALFGAADPTTRVQARRLRFYAEHKRKAMFSRATGHISDALRMENTLDAIYQTFPQWSRW